MTRKLIQDTHASIESGATMMGVVIGTLIAIVIGVLIWYKVNTGVFAQAVLPSKANDGVAYVAYNTSRTLQLNTYATVNTTANTIWTLFPIVCIVIIAGIILAIVMNFGRGTA